MQGEVKAGRRFTRTGHAHQNHIRFLKVLIADPVIVVQRKIDRLHTSIVTLRIADTVMPLFGGNRLGVEFLFQKPEEGFKKIDVESICLFDDFTDFVIDHADKRNRTLTVFLPALIDLLHHRARLFRRIDKRVRMAFERQIAKLVQQSLADILGSQTGTVGNVKHMARTAHLPSLKHRFKIPS